MVSGSSVAELFHGLDTSGMPPFASLQGDREKALWVLWVGQKLADLQQMSPAEVSDVLRDELGVSIPRQRVEALLFGARGLVARRLRKRKRVYQIMQAGIDEVNSAGATVVLVDPAQALSNIRAIEKLLSEVKGTLRLCDPYVDGRTLDYLLMCGQANAIRLLTVNIQKSSTFRRDLQAFWKERGKILEVRVHSGGQLHDRYLIHDDGMLLLGASLNGFAKKQTLVVSVGEDLKAQTTAVFDRFWGSSPVF